MSFRISSIGLSAEAISIAMSIRRAIEGHWTGLPRSFPYSAPCFAASITLPILVSPAAHTDTAQATADAAEIATLVLWVGIAVSSAASTVASRSPG